MFRSVSPIRAGIFQLAALVVAFQLGHAVPARAQAASAVIAGTITDTQAGVLPGVTVTVTNAESGTAVDESYDLSGGCLRRGHG